MSTVKIYGASDDLVEVEVTWEGGTKKWEEEYDGDKVKLVIEGQMYVQMRYSLQNGCWVAEIGQVREGFIIFPTTVGVITQRNFSALVIVEVPGTGQVSVVEAR